MSWIKCEGTDGIAHIINLQHVAHTSRTPTGVLVVMSNGVGALEVKEIPDASPTYHAAAASDEDD